MKKKPRPEFPGQHPAREPIDQAGNPSLSQEFDDLLRQTIISILWEKEEITLAQLRSLAQEQMGKSFPGFERAFERTLEHMRKFQLLEEVPGPKASRLRLAHRLDA